MKFKVDENLPVEIVYDLTIAGHDAVSVLQQNLGGSDDKRLASVFQKESRVLVTVDQEFGDIRMYPPKDYSGIVVLKAGIQSKQNLIRLAHRIVPVLEKEPLQGQLWIIEEDRIRIRD